jgi:uncharacterized membrane protein (DUF441 family)
MDFLYNQIIAGKQKAIVGYVVVALVNYLSQQGFALPANTGDVLTALVVGLIGYVAVYLKRNKA